MNSLTDVLHIPDTQAERDDRRLAIQLVGVRDVRYPLTLAVDGAAQTTPATWDLAVALAADRKGTHMSRFVAWLDQLPAPLDAAALARAFDAMLGRLQADEGRVEAAFTFFLRKKAPVSGIPSLLDYQGRWIAERQAGRTALWAEVTVPVKTLCPCSKEISDYGAHNQRSAVTVRVEVREAQPPEWRELVRFAEDNASCELWPLLKRADEKWVTERAYENPKFVEDLVRDVALAVERDPRVGRYVVEVENFESIHNHSAYARIERG
jgi:GTP cyclohydrolase I